MSEWSFIIAAYAVTWLVLLGYSVRLVRVRRRAAAFMRESQRGTGGAEQ